MEPITHALAGAAIARAAFGKSARLATPMAMVAGVVADVDVVSVLAGPEWYMRLNRTVTHSVAGTVMLAGAVAAAFWYIGKKYPKYAMPLMTALLLCFASAGSHVLLDVCNPEGVQLLWPFSAKWTAWDLLDTVDPWVLFLLIAGLLLPGLFSLVSEEIGARKPGRGAQRWAIATLVVLAVYLGARFRFHEQAMEMLNTHIYHGAVGDHAGAFPFATAPLRWTGIVSTERSFEVVEVPIGPAGAFDPDRSRSHFKPESSPQLVAAQQSAAVRRYLEFARFPLAEVERLDQGYRITLTDLRFVEGRRRGRTVVVVVELDNAARVTHEEFRYANQQ